MAPLRPAAQSLAVILILLGVAAVLASSPRHRQFYAKLLGGYPQALPEKVSRSSSPPAPAAEAPAPPPVAKAATPASTTTKPPPGSADRVVVKVVDVRPAKLPSVGVPPGWNLKEFTGRGFVEVVRDDSRLALRLVSDRSSFALYRDVLLDPKQFPILTWQWKVVKLPAGGDVRERESDDQAAQIYLVFPRWPSPRTNSDVVGYIWDTRAPAGSKLTSRQAANVRLLVVQSGPERLGRWVREERNVYQDYVELFGREPPRMGQVALMVDSNDTRSQAEALIDDLVFLRP